MVLGILLWQLWLAAISVPTRSHKVGFQCTLSTARIEILTEIHQLRDFNRSAIYILTKIQPTSTFFWFQQRIVRPSHLGSPCGPRRFTFRPWLSEVTPIGIRKVWFLKHGISLIHIKHINLRIYIYYTYRYHSLVIYTAYLHITYASSNVMWNHGLEYHVCNHIEEHKDCFWSPSKGCCWSTVNALCNAADFWIQHRRFILLRFHRTSRLRLLILVATPPTQ